MVESSIWSVTLQEVSLFVFVCISGVCPFWKCSILLLKAKQSSAAALWNRKEEFREEESLILLFAETEQCREKEITVIVMCQWCAEKRQGAVCLHQGQIAGLTSWVMPGYKMLPVMRVLL